MDSDNIFNDLKDQIAEDRILRNEPMKNHTSFKVGGNAKFLVKVNTIEEIIDVLKIVKQKNIPLVVLGNGSNILFKDERFEGIVLRIELDNLKISQDKITVSAGVKNAIIARKALENSFQGFEAISGIPGTIGGAIRMNAGAYGTEIKDVVESVTYIDFNTLEVKKISNEECDFSYRHSIFCKNKNIIVSCVLKLSKGKTEEIKTKMEECAKSRKEKQPLEYPSAGSTFKRGEGFITAKLIDDCELKGYSIGGAQVSEKHAGFIINKNNATATDIIELIEYVKKVVKEKTSKEIEIEIEII